MFYTEELIERAREMQSPAELAALAEEKGETLSESEAERFYTLLHPPVGELSDDELDNVSGGGCHSRDGRLVVTVAHSCSKFRCASCGNIRFWDGRVFICLGTHEGCVTLAICKNCKFCSYEKGLWLCNSPENRK